MSTKIVGLVGSLRRKSFNKGLMNAFVEESPENVEIEILPIDKVPHFNQDLEQDLPLSVQELKNKILASDAVIIVTPEYNRSVPGVLKNAIDWVSRPHGTNSFDGKPVLVAGATPGAPGTAMAQYHLKQTLLHLNCNVIGQPEFFVGGAKDKFDEDSNLTDETTRGYIKNAIETLVSKVGSIPNTAR